MCGFHTVECKRYIVMHVNIDTSFLFSVVASPLSKAHTTQHLELISVTSSAHCQYLSFIITFPVCSIHKMLQHNFPFHINLLLYFLLHYCATPFTCFHYHIWIWSVSLSVASHSVSINLWGSTSSRILLLSMRFRRSLVQIQSNWWTE